MKLQRGATQKVRVRLHVDGGATGGVALADADLAQLTPGGLQEVAATASDASSREWRGLSLSANGLFLSLDWRVLEPTADTTFYTATISVWDQATDVLLVASPSDHNPKSRQYTVGDIVPGVGTDAEPIVVR